MVLYKYTDETNDPNLPLSNILYNKIQRDILTNVFENGEKLTEQMLCAKYDVSRTPIREALKQLETAGLVERIPNRGFFVLGISRQDYLDMFELRKAYEVLAVRWAIERINDDEMEALEETFEFMEFYTMKNDYQKMLSINNGFHSIIFEAAHNKMLAQLLVQYQTYVKYIRHSVEDPKIYLETILEEHRKIFQAFIEKDVEGGAEAMAQHIENSKKRQLE